MLERGLLVPVQMENGLFKQPLSLLEQRPTKRLSLGFPKGGTRKVVDVIYLVSIYSAVLLFFRRVFRLEHEDI